MLSEQKNFLFVHIPKTGGNSIQSILRDYSEDAIVINSPIQDGVERFGILNQKYGFNKHTPLSQYKKLLPPDLYTRLFKFACLRNPWDMMISYYFSPHRNVHGWDRNNFIGLLRSTPTMASFITLAPGPEGGKNLPLDRDIDFLMRLETINDDFKKACDRIGIPARDLPIRNRSNRQPYSCYYDNELIEMVAEKFRAEINYGGYRFAGPCPRAGVKSYPAT